MRREVVDLINRDPNGMNTYIHVLYEDVLAEPVGVHSIDCVWRNSYRCFTCGKNFCYKLLTCLFGIFIALYWGCVFAQVSFCSIWCVTPQLRLFHICFHPIRKINALCHATFCGPVFETMGLCFSRISVTNSQGQPPKPLGSL